MAEPSSEYGRKRNFQITTEPPERPAGGKKNPAESLRFVVQKHAARNLHYDFRLELDGSLKSWAVPKGPSLDPKDKRLAVHVEDHPLDYADFEGRIPEGQYGAGQVIVWDQGIWQPHGDAEKAYRDGKLKFSLIGEKLTGDWTLVRTRLPGSGGKQQWLLIKERDQVARPAEQYDITEAQPQSVLSGTLIATDKATKKATKQAASTKPAKQAAKPRAREKPNKAEPTADRIPAQLAPELATLVTQPPNGNWLYEIKFDGYRMLARISEGNVRLFSRNGNDWTARLPLQAEAIAALGLHDSWLDGEMVALDESGLPDFQALQSAFDIGRSHNILYYLFDAPYLNGLDLRSLPVEQRRAELQKVLRATKPRGLLRFSEAFASEYRDVIESACALSLEGLIGKRIGSPYVSRRSTDWIKLKCRLRQEFVIVGYTRPQGSRSGFGALLLAVNQQLGESSLLYAGRVGSGFDQNLLTQLHEQLRQLERQQSPLDAPLRGAQARGVHWVEPQLVAEVEFAEWTREGIVRQASFIALRSDKAPSDIIRERARSTAELPPAGADRQSTEDEAMQDERRPSKTAKPVGKAQPKGRVKVTGVSISSPERLIDEQSATHKLELAQFYAQIDDWIMPHLRKHPVSLLRAPDGVAGEQFFQKHAEHMSIPNIKHLPVELDPGHARLMEINKLSALIGAVQMGAIEFHTWGASSARIETPDRLVLDLDPDPALPWRSMLEATRLCLSVLDELGLESYLKTSGGKGIHLVVPLARHAGWNEVKTFAKAISQFMARQIPERFSAKMGPKNRVGKIFVDYLRNQRGASTVAAYSVRARPGLPVSVPIRRDELDNLRSAAQWHIGNLLNRLDHLRDDPWADYNNRQRITRAMWEKLGGEDV
jgi:bifunctional non-homologous end joining protein LigD